MPFVVLTLRVDNNSKFVRRKKGAIADIERHVLRPYSATQRPDGTYEVTIPYYTDEGLDKIVDELLREIFEGCGPEKLFLGIRSPSPRFRLPVGMKAR